MAILGLTNLEMLNQVMEAIVMPPATALPSASADTVSIYARGEDMLDRIGRRILAKGWPCNSINGKTYTSTGTPSLITITDVLKVRCTGPGRYKDKLSLQGDDLYLMDDGTTDFGTATAVILDVILNISIERASPDVKEIIASETAKEFQRRHKGSGTQDAFLTEEHARADIGAVRLVPADAKPFNPAPLLLGGGQQQERREQQ
jgi:hypothetical protein